MKLNLPYRYRKAVIRRKFGRLRITLFNHFKTPLISFYVSEYIYGMFVVCLKLVWRRA